MKNNALRVIEAALAAYVKQRLPKYGLACVHPLLERTIAEFILRPGKRIRPVLFSLSYRGHAPRATLSPDAVRASLAFELLHDFLLVHDDIIDNSSQRRGRPTMHIVFQKALRTSAKTGQDLALVAADIIYALSVDALLDIRAPALRKEQALRLFLQAAITTGAGEYKDVVNGFVPLSRISLADIRQNYLCKTAAYTFSAPLACGCVLSGGSANETKRMQRFGMLLGEAFQIQDDMIGIFGRSSQIGKSILSDIAEAKKTLPLFYTYERACSADRSFLDSRLGRPDIRYGDLQKIRRIMKNTGAVQRTQALMHDLIAQATALLNAASLSSPAQQELQAMLQRWFPAPGD